MKMISKDDRERIERWFSEHKATFLKDRYSRIIDWKKPGTVCYGVTYTWQGSYMIVTGDLGITVFQVPAMSFEFFNDCELDYLIGKVVATSTSSRGERPGYTWNEAAAKNHILGIRPERSLSVEDRKTLRMIRARLGEACQDPHLLYQEANRLSDELESVFGSDWYSIIPSHTYEPSIHMSSHYLGLKMAIKQLKDQGVSIEG